MSEMIVPPPPMMEQEQQIIAPKPGVEADFFHGEQLDQFLEHRVGDALRNSEFQESPELRDSVEGFYTDHYSLAGAIDAVADGRYDDPIFGRILGDSRIKPWEQALGSTILLDDQHRDIPSPNAITAAYRLARMAQDLLRVKDHVSVDEMKQRHFRAVKQAGGDLTDVLFREVSVGITTIDQGELDIAESLAAKLLREADGRHIAKVYNGRRDFQPPEVITANIRKAQEKFWADTRHAGQLEFHSTPHIGNINVTGLMSRNQQVRKFGHMQAETAVNFGGQTMHSVVPHFAEYYGARQYGYGEEGATLVIPLAKIIDQAPFARDAQYGFLKLKDDADQARVPKPTLSKQTGDVGGGKFDYAGERGDDRVFFASPDERSDTMPDDYSVKMTDKNNKPATYIIDKTTLNHHNDIELGLGYGLPERLVINEDTDVNAAIAEMQQAYFEAYNSRGIVVPLRRGVFAQMFENQPPEIQGARPGAEIYNRYVQGSERPIAS